MLLCSLFHVTIAILLRGCARDLTFFRDKRLFKFFNLLVILHDFTFDFRNNVLARLRYILLGTIIHVVKWVWFFTLERRSWNLWSTLHFRWQVSSLKFSKLVLELLLFFLGYRAAHVVIVDVLLR